MDKELKLLALREEKMVGELEKVKEFDLMGD